MSSDFINKLKQIPKVREIRLFPSYTPDESTFIRANIDEYNYTVSLEIFYDYDESDPEDVECVMTIYKKDLLVMNNMGTLEECCRTIFNYFKNEFMLNL